MLKYRNGKDPFDEIADFVILHEGFEENKSGKDLVTGARWIGSGVEVPKYLELFDKTGKWTAADNRKAVKEILSGYTPQLKKTFGPVWDKLSSNQKLVLYDVAYNIGIENLAEKSPKFVKAVLSGDNETAMREMNWGNHQARGLRNRNSSRQARWGGVPFKLDPIKFTKTGDGNKVMTIDPEYWEQLGMLQPVQKEQPVLQSVLIEPVKTIAPRIEDVAPAPWDLNQQSLNRGIEVKPYKSPFSLNLSLPSLDSLLLINSPLRLMEQYFADALGISDMLPLAPSLFPRLKNGKLPKFENGAPTDPPVTLDYGSVGEIVVTPPRTWKDKEDLYPGVGSGTSADTTWHEQWLNGRKRQLSNNVQINPRAYKKFGTDTVEGQLNNLRNTKEYYTPREHTETLRPQYSEDGELGYYTEHKQTGSYPFADATTGEDVNPLGAAETRMYRKGNYIGYAGQEELGDRDPDEVMTHERTHALNSFNPKDKQLIRRENKYVGHALTGEDADLSFGNTLPQHAKIKEINKRYKYTPLHSIEAERRYYSNPEEIYAGLMELRRALGLSPDYTVTPEDIKKWRSEGKLNEYMKDKSDEILLEYFNEVASNPNPLFDPNAILYSFGPTNGKILYARDGKIPEYSNGKPIRIKPANRGKLTRLKKRTGKSESELYNDGNPAHRKMVVFARNARKWRH